MRQTKKLCVASLLFFLFSSYISLVHATSIDDAYIAGYAAALLEREFNVTSGSLQVKDGVVIVHADTLGGADREKVVSLLSGIRGVAQVEIQDADPTAPSAPSFALGGPEAGDPRTVHAPVASPESTFLPDGQLFQPLLADPRWPHFSAAYLYYIEDEEVRHASATNFGENFALYRDQGPFGGQWEVGIQAAVFALFDLRADSKDLINADYFVALPLSYRRSDFSILGRVFHQSSHLGDEFLLRNRGDRVNLSYEGLDALLSYDLFQMFRLYGGGGGIFHQEPSDLDTWSTQFGGEFTSPRTYWGGAVRPIAAADFQLHEEHAWSTDISIRTGVQFESPRIINRRLQLLIEYFKGHSPNGQFYERKIEYIGLGAHLHF